MLFLYLFATKSKEGSFGFAEKVPNGRGVGLKKREFRPHGRKENP